MLDINKIRQDKEVIKKSLLKRMEAKDLNLDKILEIDDERKKLLQQAESLKAERNKYSKTKPSPDIIKKMKTLGEKIKKLDIQIREVELELNEKLSDLPNIAANDVVAGGKENNKVIKTVGQQTKFNFKSKDHVQLATELDIIDYQRPAKMAGTGFWAYKGAGAILEWALLNYFVDFHRKNNYQFLIGPFLLNEKSAYASGHLPKFRDDLYWTQKENLCLNATAEMIIGNYHRDEILPESDLPLKYFSYSVCFRREAGSYRKEERGMIRGHQFNKIEIFQFAKPDQSWQGFEEMTKIAEQLTEGLDLHFQSVQLAAGDASAAMAKTIDIEVWIPSMKTYKEVSSISNALDYQARRGNIRYKDSKTKKNDFVHTLNASGLATTRLFPAILEQFQNKDGSVNIPKILHKYTGFKKIEMK